MIGMLPLLKYGPGGKYPIQRPSGSPWIVIDAVGYNWKALTEVPWASSSDACAMDIFLDRDDPSHTFLQPEAWAPLPNAKKLSAAYNRPYERNFRLRIARAAEYNSIAQIMDPHYEAADALILAGFIRSDPESDHYVGELGYYPDGHTMQGPQVWRRGQFWVRVSP